MHDELALCGEKSVFNAAVPALSIDTLLQPVSAEQPAGDDLSYDPGFQELETLIRGKPETQFSPAEDPNWKDIRERAVALLGRSKDLRVTVMLDLALLKTDGLPGFRDGLGLLRGSLEQYWETLYPRLDPEDNNDPLERINILSSMVTPLGTFDDPYRFLQRLREAPLCSSARMGRFSLADILGEPAAGGAAVGAETKTPPTTAQVEAAFRDTDAATLEAISQAISESVATVKAIDDVVTRTVGESRALDWAPLLSTLSEMQKAIAPFVLSAATPADDVAAATGGGAEQKSGGGAPGTITSRRDVVAALDRICDFYKRSEPSSPVPFLLRRARRLVEKDFMEIVNDLTPEALAALRIITGETSGEVASAAAAEPAPETPQ